METILLRGGYFAVEAFFIFTGYLAVQKVKKTKMPTYRDAFCWTCKNAIKFYVYVFPTVMIHYLFLAQLEGRSLVEILKAIINSMFEVFLLHATRIRQTMYLGHLWYLSAILLLMPLFYSAIIRGKEWFLYILCPISCWTIYSYFSEHYGNLASWDGALIGGLFVPGIPRAWAGLCLGGIVWILTEELRNRHWTVFGKWFLSIIEMICLAGTVLYMYANEVSRKDFICVGLWGLIASIVFSEQAVHHNSVPKVFSQFSEFTLALYVGHLTVRDIVYNVLPVEMLTMRIVAYVGGAIVYGIVLVGWSKAIWRWNPYKRIIE